MGAIDPRQGVWIGLMHVCDDLTLPNGQDNRDHDTDKGL